MRGMSSVICLLAVACALRSDPVRKPPSDELGVRLQAPLVEAETGKHLGVLEIPLIVRR